MIIQFSETLQGLEIKRIFLKDEILRIGNMLLEIISETYQKYGKPSCDCVREGDQYNGSVYVLYRRGKDEKLIGRSILPKFVEQTKGQGDECHRFRSLA